jgi:anti-sigma factor RsiW
MTPACTKTRELLDDALDGRLDAAARAELDRHVQACPACAAEWDLATSLRESLLKIGLEPAPAGLRESIAAEVRKTGGQKRRSPFGVARAAAAILVLASLAWFGLKSQKTGERPAPERAAPKGEVARDAAPPPPRGAAEKLERSDLARAPAGSAVAAPQRKISTVPGEKSWTVDIPAESDALGRARALVDSGAAGGDVDKFVEPGVTPEERLRQAEALVMLHENLRELTEAAGERKGLGQLAKDADGALEVFAERRRADKGLVAKEAEEAKNLKDALDEDARRKAELEVAEGKAAAQPSLSKVAPAPKPEGTRGRAAGDDAVPDEPAFFVVSGPGAVGRVERVLADRGLQAQEVWLKDRGDNLKKQKLDAQATAYRIVEVLVPADGWNDLIGDLESLPSLQLAPVGRTAGAAPAAPTGGGGAGGGATPPRMGGRGGASGKQAPESRTETALRAEAARPAPAPDRPKSLQIRRLRLVLIGD